MCRVPPTNAHPVPVSVVKKICPVWIRLHEAKFEKFPQAKAQEVGADLEEGTEGLGELGGAHKGLSHLPEKKKSRADSPGLAGPGGDSGTGRGGHHSPAPWKGHGMPSARPRPAAQRKRGRPVKVPWTGGQGVRQAWGPPPQNPPYAPPQSPPTLPEGAGAISFPAVVAFPLQLSLQDLQGFISKEACREEKKKDLEDPPTKNLGVFCPPLPSLPGELGSSSPSGSTMLILSRERRLSTSLRMLRAMPGYCGKTKVGGI